MWFSLLLLPVPVPEVDGDWIFEGVSTVTLSPSELATDANAASKVATAEEEVARAEAEASAELYMVALAVAVKVTVIVEEADVGAVVEEASQPEGQGPLVVSAGHDFPVSSVPVPHRVERRPDGADAADDVVDVAEAVLLAMAVEVQVSVTEVSLQ